MCGLVVPTLRNTPYIEDDGICGTEDHGLPRLRAAEQVDTTVLDAVICRVLYVRVLIPALLSRVDWKKSCYLSMYEVHQWRRILILVDKIQEKELPCSKPHLVKDSQAPGFGLRSIRSCKVR